MTPANVPAAGRQVTQSSVSNYFDREAGVWQDLYRRPDIHGIVFRKRQAVAVGWVDALRLPPGSRALEVGCGAGLVSSLLAKRGFRVDAVDPAPGMVQLARRHAEEAGLQDRITVSMGDAHALAYPDSSFDLVIALGVLPWLHSPEIALSEMSRVIRQAGYLIVTADNRARLAWALDPRCSAVLAPARRAVRRRLHPTTTADRRVTPRAAMHRPREVDQLVTSAGFRKLGQSSVGFAPMTLFGRPLFPAPMQIGIQRLLQSLADRDLPGVRAGGSHYLVLARKP